MSELKTVNGRAIRERLILLERIRKLEHQVQSLARFYAERQKQFAQPSLMRLAQHEADSPPGPIS